MTNISIYVIFFLGESYHFLDRKTKVKRFFMEVNANEYIHFA